MWYLLLLSIYGAKIVTQNLRKNKENAISFYKMAYEGDLYHDVSRAQLFPTARSHVTSAAI